MSVQHAKAILLLSAALLAFPGASRAQADDPSTRIAIGPEAFQVMRHFFEYDRGVPLEARVVARLEAQGHSREKIVFRGTRDSRVPGYLAIPTNAPPPYPCVLLMHGIGSTKEDWWQESSFPSGGHLTRQLLASGFAVLTLDAEYHGERMGNNDYESPMVFTFERGWMQRARDMIVQSTIEHRRAIDYLGTRADIDTSRVGVIGYSMGGIMTFTLAAVDARISAAVASVTPILNDPYSAIAVHNFAPFIHQPAFLMLMGDADSRNYSPDDARQLHDLVPSAAKGLVLYESGHRLPLEWTETASAWMEKHLR